MQHANRVWKDKRAGRQADKQAGKHRVADVHAARQVST